MYAVMETFLEMNLSLYSSYTLDTTSLCPYTDGTSALYARWFADQELVNIMGDWDFYPLPYYEQTPEEYTKRTRCTTWLVCASTDEEMIPIGYTGLYIQHRHRVGILRLAIAERAYRRQGHGKRALFLALKWAFVYLDLFAVHATTSAANTSAFNLCRSAGFRECGRRTLSRFSPEGRSDEILMELLQEKWMRGPAGSKDCFVF